MYNFLMSSVSKKFKSVDFLQSYFKTNGGRFCDTVYNYM